MGLVLESASGTDVEVGLGSASAAHVQVRPQTAFHGNVIDQYQCQTRFNLVNSQAAANQSVGMVSVIANRGNDPIILERLRVRWTQTAAHTAQILARLAVQKLWYPTPHTNGSTAGVILPRRADGVNVSSNSTAAIQSCVSGANGLNGAGELPVFEGGNPAAAGACWLFAMEMMMQATLPTTTQNQQVWEVLDDEYGLHPITLVRNEAVAIINIVLLGVAAGSQGAVTYEWAEPKVF